MRVSLEDAIRRREQEQRREASASFWIVLVFAVIGFAVIYGMGWATCARYATVAGTRYDYSVVGGCLVQAKSGEWFPLDRIRGMVGGAR